MERCRWDSRSASSAAWASRRSSLRGSARRSSASATAPATAAFSASRTRSDGMAVFDVHLHVQPHAELDRVSRDFIESGRTDRELYAGIERSPAALLAFLDAQEIERACLINYVAPDTVGPTDNVNDWVLRYCGGHEDRLLAVGSVHPRLAKDPGGQARRLFDEGLRMLKLHPPHQLFSADDYLRGNDGLAEIYAAAQAAARPVMFHTGTSIFPSARNRFADPMPIDDVAVDFPGLPIVLAHSGRPLHCETA